MSGSFFFSSLFSSFHSILFDVFWFPFHGSFLFIYLVSSFFVFVFRFLAILFFFGICGNFIGILLFLHRFWNILGVFCIGKAMPIAPLQSSSMSSIKPLDCYTGVAQPAEGHLAYFFSDITKPVGSISSLPPLWTPI